MVIMQMINGMLGKGPQLLGYGLAMAKFALGTKEDDRFVHIHKFRNVFAHFARVVRDKQNGDTVFPVQFAQ